MRPSFYRLNPFQRVVLFWRSLSLPGLFVASFAFLIALGTAGLCVLPGIYVGERVSFWDALFTMTHAVCLTGLTVFDVSKKFTFFGQLWLLLFIQMGGLGLFTFSSLIIGSLGRRMSIRSELLTSTSLEGRSRSKDVGDLARQVARFALLLEGVGALILWPQLVREFSLRGILDGLWNAVFLAITAFCNAGLALYPDSLASFARRPFVLLPISILVILGGLGFLVFEETIRWWKSRGAKCRQRFSTHSLCVFAVTGALLLSGFLSFLILEWSGVLADFGIVDKIVNAFVMSVMSRTAGFTSVDYSLVSNETAYMTILLMFIGGSPGSTASGLKTTTAAVILAQAVARIRGRRYVSMFHRTISPSTVRRATSSALMTLMILLFVLFLLSFTERGLCGGDVAMARKDFLPLIFETVSALSTVGLSLGFDCPLSHAGHVVLIILMFIGRVGLVAFSAAISLREKDSLSGFRPAQENVFIG